MTKQSARRTITMAAITLALTTTNAALGERVPTSQDATASTPCIPWPATDALSRRLPMPDEVGQPKPDRFVGIFYFLWHNQPHDKCPHLNGPCDVSKILAADPDAVKKPSSPLWGQVGSQHYWGEPLYGYYLSTDPWVFRRHAQLLADAGIDMLIFDTTNAVTYRDVYLKLCEVFQQVRREGTPAPQIAFMVNTHAGQTAQKIYEELYKPGLFRELWFYWQGKPLLICDPEQATPELRKFFTLRRAHWPFKMIDTPYAWHWEATYPQPFGFTDDPKQPEQVNVSVAQNLRVADGQVTNMSDGNARGRSFHKRKLDTSAGAVNNGYNFQEQWTRAFELNPPFVMVTGWNEWIAGRFARKDGSIMFVDQYSQECSRDIEPMKGGHGDNYYWQLIANVRRYKGAAALPEASPPTTIDPDQGFAAWQNVQPEFRDHVGETLPRDFGGSGDLHYTNRTGRNDIIVAKVARDRDNVYFYVRTRQPLTSPNDKNWMWLLIDSDRNAATGWQGYDFIINRTAPGRLEKNTGKWNWADATDVGYRIAGNEMQIAVPRKALGLPADTTTLALDFKWADNIQQPGDIMDFYISGDVAPEGRFNYRYLSRNAE